MSRQWSMGMAKCLTDVTDFHGLFLYESVKSVRDKKVNRFDTAQVCDATEAE